MRDLLIQGGTIISMDPQRRIIENGAILVREGRIAAIGQAEDLLASDDAEIIPAAGKVVMPGLIDVHAHAGHGLIKTMGMDTPGRWESICGEVYTTGSTLEYWHAEARLAALERLRFGVTCGVSLLGGGDTIMRTDDPIYGDAHCRGVAEIGTRSVVAVGPTRAPHPRTYADWRSGSPEYRPVSFDDQLQTCRRLIDLWHKKGDERITLALLYPVLRDEHEDEMSQQDYLEAVRQAKIVRALSREAGLLFTQDGHWRGSVRRASTLGLLGPDALLSHAIDLHDDEIELCAATDTKIAHNPSAIASIMGRCPAMELIARGVTVAIGSDATAPDRSGDMFRHLQQAMHYHRTHFRDPAVLPAGRALAMVTIDAARALGMDADIGSLEPGKAADIVMVNMNRPHLHPVNMEAYRVACFANGNDVDTVLVGGEVLLRDGQLLRVNSSEILHAAQKEADAMIDRIGATRDLALPSGFWG